MTAYISYFHHRHCVLTVILHTLRKSLLQTSTHRLHSSRGSCFLLWLGIVFIKQLSQKHRCNCTQTFRYLAD